MSGAGTSARGRPGETAPGSIVVLQVIDVEYGKAARGGAAARRRATLPTSFPVPTSTSDVVHKVELWAGNDYRPSSSVDPLGPVPPGASRVVAASVRASASTSSTDQWSAACAPYLAATMVPPGSSRKSAGRPR